MQLEIMDAIFGSECVNIAREQACDVFSRLDELLFVP